MPRLFSTSAVEPCWINLSSYSKLITLTFEMPFSCKKALTISPTPPFLALSLKIYHFLVRFARSSKSSLSSGFTKTRSTRIASSLPAS